MMNHSTRAADSALVRSSEPTWRLVLNLAVPVLIQQSLSLVVLLSDQYLAGHLPPEEIGDDLAWRCVNVPEVHYIETAEGRVAAYLVDWLAPRDH